MKGKVVHCFGHDHLFVDAKCEQPWSVVWIRWTSKPGRKKRRFGPTLISKPDAQRDLDITEKCAAENPDLDYTEDLRRERALLAAISNGEDLYIDTENWYVPTIATGKDGINRFEAERMLRHYLSTVHNIKLVRFKWHRPHIIVIPT